jgi:uncharacterized protein (TIGR03086 family)
MPTISSLPVLHRRALDAVSGLLVDLAPADLDRPTPCAGWDLRQLLGHMIGQNLGFAAAAEHDVGVEEFAPRPVAGDARRAWSRSADRVAAALAAAVEASTDQKHGRTILLAEFAQYGRLPAPFVLGMQVLDTAVHGWDVAGALGAPYRPDDELVAVTLQLARQVPTGATREEPGASFAPPVAGDPGDGGDPWVEALRLLGREPAVADAPRR